jgi:hypothetical protein
MGRPSPADLRIHERLEIVDHRLPGILRRDSDGQPIFASALDVSQGGLGIAVGEALAVGSDVILTPDGAGDIRLRVIWQKAQRRKGCKIFRYGLALLDRNTDLVSAFFAAGRLEYKLGEPNFETPGESPA